MFFQKKKFAYGFISLLQIFQINANSSFENIDDSSKENYVDVHFMDSKRTEFIETLSTIKKAIFNSLNEFGRDKKFKSNFSINNIGFVGNNEKEKFVEEGRFVKCKVFVKHFSDEDFAEKHKIKRRNSEIQNEMISDYLSKSILEEFFINYRDKIVQDCNVEIAYINNKLVYPKRNNLDNWLIVSLSCIFCVMLISINLVCQRKSNKKIIGSLKKNSNIYKSIDKIGHLKTSEKLSLSSDSLKKNERSDMLLPNNNKNNFETDDDLGYVEPFQRFPIPNQPMLFTNSKPIQGTYMTSNSAYKMSKV